jgi:hypothetical protein
MSYTKWSTGTPSGKNTSVLLKSYTPYKMPPPSLREAQHACCVDLARLKVDDAVKDSRLSAYSKYTLYRWRSEYTVMLELPMDMSERRKQVTGGKFRRKKRKLTPEVLDTLSEMYKKNSQLYFDEAKRLVSVNTGTELSLKTISIAVGKNLNRTRQLLFAKASQADGRERQQFLDYCSSFPDPNVFIDVDETNK